MTKIHHQSRRQAMIIKDFGKSLGTSKMLDARRRILDPAVVCGRSADKAYQQYAASPSTSLRIVSLSNGR